MTGNHINKHQKKGYFCRWTAPRKAILNLLRRTSKHMSAKEIHAELFPLYPGIGLTTVYRTLDLLVRMGLIDRLAFGTGESRFEYKAPLDKSHHHHLVCTSCGRIIDYRDFIDEEKVLIAKTESMLTRKYDFRIDSHDITFFGLCDRCRKPEDGVKKKKPVKR